MPKQGKRFRADIEGWDREAIFPLSEAISKVKSFRKTKFDQSVEMCIHLGIDPKHADQLVRGAVALPHGIGKS